MTDEPMLPLLSWGERTTFLDDMPDWSYSVARRALFRHIRVSDFAEAFALMTEIARVAIESDHHPEWLNTHNRIDIWLTTRPSRGVTQKDVALAKQIDRILIARCN